LVIKIKIFFLFQKNEVVVVSNHFLKGFDFFF